MQDINSLLGFQPKTPQRSMIRLHGAAAGSTNGTTRTWTTVTASIGDAINYIKDPALGDSFVLRSSGLYFIYYNDSANASQEQGITVNGDPSLSIGNNTDLSRVASTVTSATGIPSAVSVMLWLNERDTIRAQTTNSGIGAGGDYRDLVITQVCAP